MIQSTKYRSSSVEPNTSDFRYMFYRGPDTGERFIEFKEKSILDNTQMYRTRYVKLGEIFRIFSQDRGVDEIVIHVYEERDGIYYKDSSVNLSALHEWPGAWPEKLTDILIREIKDKHPEYFI